MARIEIDGETLAMTFIEKLEQIEEDNDFSIYAIINEAIQDQGGDSDDYAYITHRDEFKREIEAYYKSCINYLVDVVND